MNRLASERSPYLLQHARNPVDWRPWGAEAIDEARRLDRPLFVSIGYATCHWCHVMAHESFEDPGVGRLLGEQFVSVKVDREERPEVDEYCMTACQIFSQLVEGRPSGGWPLSIWLHPTSLAPFFVGTYFPPEPAHGRPSFSQVVQALGSAWRTRRHEIDAQATRLATLVKTQLSSTGDPVEIPANIVDDAASRLMAIHDREWGGFGGAPKFPQAPALEMMIEAARGPGGGASTSARAGARATTTAECSGRSAILAAVRRTLERMAAGGIQDQVAGGFHRYAVDREWVVPHFEKMLYDNGQLASLYARMSLRFGDARLLEVAARACLFVLRELQSPQGGFLCAIDADADGREGAGHVWSREAFERAFREVGAEALHARAVAIFGLDRPPNFRDPHHPDVPAAWVLRDLSTWNDAAAGVQSEDAVAARSIASAEPPHADSVRGSIHHLRAILLAARASFPQPTIDDKVVPAWNGLMIEGLAETAWTLREWENEKPAGAPELLKAGGAPSQQVERLQWAPEAFFDAARAAADFTLREMRGADGGLVRTWRGGASTVPASLEDSGLMARGLATLAGAEQEESRRRRWIDAAASLLDAAEVRFADGRGAWFDSPADTLVPVRARSLDDGAIPSGTTAMIGAMRRLADLLDMRGAPHADVELARSLRARAAAAIRASSSTLVINPLGSMGLLAEISALRRADPALV